MKNKLYIICLFIIIFQSCAGVLDKPPLDVIAGDVIWNDANLSRAYVTNLYTRINFYGLDMSDQCEDDDEATNPSGGASNITQGTVNANSEARAYWDYTYIRDCSYFLQQMATSTIDATTKNQMIGEVRVIRAFIYYEMMKRYGGIPLVDVVLDPFSPIPDKYTMRATEDAIATFIDTELTTAEGLLTDVATPRGKINKWTAYAIQARSDLWAASIAKYSTVQLNGIVGIPAGNAATYYAKAIAAANMVINSGKYALYNPQPANKSENYRHIFLDRENSEIIFEKAYDGVNLAHSYNSRNAPTEFASRGAILDPTVQFMLTYENADGSTTAPVWGPGTLYPNGWALWAKKDPRLLGTVMFQGDAWSTGTINSYDAIDPNPTPSYNIGATFPGVLISGGTLFYQGVLSVGKDSKYPISVDNTLTGFTTKKYIDPTKNKIGDNLDNTPWIAIRLAEMYLIVAEANMETGNIPLAVAAVNYTRARAGIILLDASTITVDKVRSERTHELAFEGHRYWDVRRWRIAQTVMSGVQMQGLHIILHFATQQYYFAPFNAETFIRNYTPQMNYNPITAARIANNPKLIENPLY